MKSFPTVLPVLAAAFLYTSLVSIANADTQVGTCPFVGPAPDATEVCKQLRAVYSAEIRDCMAELKAAADARAGKVTAGSPQANRSRMFICESEVRQDLGLASN